MTSVFSSRLPPSIEPNRLALALEARRAAGLPLLDLTESNPTAVGLRCPPKILDALTDPAALRYQPTPRGLGVAREAVAAYYARHGAAVDPERLFLTASTSEAYALLFKLLCDPGDAVLVPRPSYPLFDLLAGLEAVTPRSYPLRYHHGWFIDLDALAAEIDARVRAILVVHPNNPTGSLISPAEADALEHLAAARGLALVSDEVFLDSRFAPGEAAGTFAARDEALTFTLSGLSKVVGLPQLKLGWIHVSGPRRLREAAEARLELIADTYLSVSAPVMHAAPRLLSLVDVTGVEIATRVRRNRAALAVAVRGTAATLLDADAGWSAIVRVPETRSEEEWALLLLKDGVRVHPGFFFDLLGGAHLVVSLLCEEERFDAGVARVLGRVG